MSIALLHCNENKHNQMKKSKTNVPAHCGTIPQYGLRAECMADAVQIRAVLGAWLTIWREDQVQLDFGTRGMTTVPDIDVVFSVSKDGPTLPEIRWLLSALVDCHVAEQSVEPLRKYTGERTHHAKMPRISKRPNDALIERAIECARVTKVAMRNEGHRIDDAVLRLSAELGATEPYIDKEARRMAQLWQNGLGPEEDRYDDAKALAIGRYMATECWNQAHADSVHVPSVMHKS